MPASSNHSLYLMKLFVFSCPEGKQAARLFDSFSPPFSRHNERSERQYRHEPPPAFALLKPRSPSFNSLLKLLSMITEHRHRHRCRHIHVQMHIHIRSHISQKVHVCIYICVCVIMNRHGRHNIRNGIVWVQTGTSTCTCTATSCVCVCLKFEHQKFESFKKKIPQRQKSNRIPKTTDVVRNYFRPHGNDNHDPSFLGVSVGPSFSWW